MRPRRIPSSQEDVWSRCIVSATISSLDTIGTSSLTFAFERVFRVRRCAYVWIEVCYICVCVCVCVCVYIYIYICCKHTSMCMILNAISLCNLSNPSLNISFLSHTLMVTRHRYIFPDEHKGKKARLQEIGPK